MGASVNDKFFTRQVCAAAQLRGGAGPQGSYGRGEATESRDIDLVVILDELLVSDISQYNSMLDTLPDRDLICGFLSGREELFHWEASDLFQFYYDTKPIKGSLDGLLVHIDKAAVNTAIKIGACNIYHGCVHNMLYEKSEDILRSLYKSASFVVQAVCFRQTGRYVIHQKELLDMVSGEDENIVRTYLDLKNGSKADFSNMSDSLFLWAKGRINQ